MGKTQTAKSEAWPSLRVDDWTATRDTLHMWTQIVGKIRLAQAPLVNHWWQVTLYVSPRGLTTVSMPYADRLFDIEFDFCDHQLVIRSSDGGPRTSPWNRSRSRTSTAETMQALGRLGFEVEILARPNEVEPAIPFAEDTQHAAYDADAVHLFWRQLVQARPGHRASSGPTSSAR